MLCCVVLVWALLVWLLSHRIADKASEAVCIAAIQETFPDHLILGEEGGVIGQEGSDYLW